MPRGAATKEKKKEKIRDPASSHGGLSSVKAEWLIRKYPGSGDLICWAQAYPLSLPLTLDSAYLSGPQFPCLENQKGSLLLPSSRVGGGVGSHRTTWVNG